jgi:hypothetical protein
MKAVPAFKFQRRPNEARLDPDADNFLELVAKRSWAESIIIGADTETLDGYARLITYEQRKVTGWTKNRKPMGYHYEGQAEEVNSFMDCIMAMLRSGYTHSKTVQPRGKRNGSYTVRRWVTPQLMFWNLQFDAQAILKWLKEIDSELLDLLIKTGEIKYIHNEDKGEVITITYLEGKWLRFSFDNFYIIKKGKKWKVSDLELWDISQFYFKTPLTVQAKKDLGYGKVETCFDGSPLDASKFGDHVCVTGNRFPYDEDDYRYEPYWDYYKDDIIHYAKVDAEMCGQLARRKRNEYVQAGVRFNRTYSPANVAQNHLLDLGFNQTVNLMQNDKDVAFLMEMAQWAYHGGNFDVSKIGYIKDCVQPDIVSAYPYIMYQLNSLINVHLTEDEKGKVKREEELRGYIMRGDEDEIEVWEEWFQNRDPYTLGFIYVEMDFPEGQSWYPLLEEVQGTLTAPRCFSGVITADELKEALLWEPLRVEYGEWVFYQDDNPDYPFRPAIDRLYRMKKESEKGTAQYKVSKVAINSLYGKVLQAVEDTMGKLWNVAYGSVICGATRARLAEINRLNGKSAISMATDGVIFRREDLKVIPKRPLDAPYDLGEWEVDPAESGDAIILGSGVYSFVNEKYDYEGVDPSIKREHTYKTTVRGSAKLFMRKHGFVEWKSFCEHFGDEEILSLTKSRPLSMKQSRMKGERVYEELEDGTKQLVDIKGDYSHVNIFTEQTYTLKPFGDSTKRICPVRPPTFRDLLENEYDLLPHESGVAAGVVRNLADATGNAIIDEYGEGDHD